MDPSPPAILVLEDGRTFRGWSFGAVGETFGEAVFSTGMSGYEETLTDPSYYQQIVVATAPHIGNTGWNSEDIESARIWVAGYVVRDPSPRVSSWRAEHSLEDELVRQGIVGIRGIDTRALTRHLRDNGAMRAGISSLSTDADELAIRVRQQPTMVGANLIPAVTTSQPYLVPAIGDHRHTVVALDLGIKAMTPHRMAQRGMAVHVLPADTDFATIQALNPDGLFFSNGPGDPSTATTQIQLLRQALGVGLPFFGICLGHQIFGLALGLTTYKLVFGHRGINQPVIERRTGRIAITAHNHGFAVDAPLDQAVSTPFGDVAVSHVCLNDQVVEGLELRRGGRLVGFSVQYHPEAAAGPHDADQLFDRFAAMMAARRTPLAGREAAV